MRLLQYDGAGNISFTKDVPEAELPKYPYAILSHTWGPDEEEITYDDVVSKTCTTKPGIGSKKIRFCIQQARQDGLEYFWVDTCCIDKRNLVELSRALISMFRWYSKAEKCYAFLWDVTYSFPKPSEEQESKSWEEDFRSSRWFTRGWTLQELLAPSSLDFFSSDGHNLGTKASLGQVISEITRIPIEALYGQSLGNFTLQERFRWQENRQTKEEEDIIYSLMGIFNVSMPVLYGEGKAQALLRLRALLEQPEIPPKPSSNIPSRRDPNFVERAALTDQIRAKLTVPAGRAALVGLGGVGKSQLAIEYARQLLQSHETWVFWIHASNPTRFEQSIRDVTDLLKIKGRQDQKANILRLFRDWLRDGRNGSWMIVLDNADDATFLLEQPATTNETQTMQSRIDYLSACEHGSILITTRSKSEALKLVYEDEVVNVMPMSEGEAEALLVRKLGRESVDDRALALALDCMPLAITQAAAYIKERGMRCSVQQYREQMERSRGSRTSLLRRHVPLPSRDAEASNAVMLTWQISFEHLYKDKTRRSAAELLSLMSFCDRLAIPEVLIRVESEDTSVPNRQSTFDDDIVALRNFSFVKETIDGHAWEMHRLVQDATQVWLEDRGRLAEMLHRFIHRIYTIFPTGEFENWPACRALLPHVISLTEHKPVDRDVQMEWASVMYKAAWYAKERGDYSIASRMAVSAMQARVEQLGEANEQTLWSISIVAETNRKQGRWKEAEVLEVQVMETRKRVLGEEHPDTLTSMANLASTYSNQGRWKEAEVLEVQVMETTKRVLGKEHPDKLTSMANLASTYSNLGRWKEAEVLEVQVMETRKRVLGEEHPFTLTSIANLASTYWNQGRWKEAEVLDVQVMETRKRVLGEEHPSTLNSIANLASTYWNQGRWKEAEVLDVQVMETRKRVLREEHPDTLTSIANLASTYRNQGRWREAEVLEVQVMETTKRVLGEEHPDTLTSMANLASTYWNQGRWKEAERLQTQAVDGLKQSHGLQHPHTLAAILSLAHIQRIRGQDTEVPSRGKMHLSEGH